MVGYVTPGTEGVEDGSGTTVDGSVETTLKSASFASIQFVLIGSHNIDSTTHWQADISHVSN